VRAFAKTRRIQCCFCFSYKEGWRSNIDARRMPIAIDAHQMVQLDDVLHPQMTDNGQLNFERQSD
jgi:hypothetical protein